MIREREQKAQREREREKQRQADLKKQQDEAARKWEAEAPLREAVARKWEAEAPLREAAAHKRLEQDRKQQQDAIAKRKWEENADLRYALTVFGVGALLTVLHWTTWFIGFPMSIWGLILLVMVVINRLSRK